MADRKINYLNRDFNSFKEQLINYAKNYFPDTYTDFSDTSVGMMFIEMASYVGDVLSFYQDTQLQETFLQYAKDPVSLYGLAYMMGYRPKVVSPAIVEMTIYQNNVPTILDEAGNYVPNLNKAYRLDAYIPLKCNNNNSTVFLTQDPVDFAYSSSIDPTEVYYFEDGSTIKCTLAKKVKAFAADKKTQSFTFGNYEKYPTVTLEDKNIVGILNAQDSAGNAWVEVPFLGQNTILNKQLNTEITSGSSPYTLVLEKVPRRFVSRFKTDSTLEIQFGAGMSISQSVDQLPRPLVYNSSSYYDTAYDPSNFMFTESYGLAPVNTSIEFTYLTSNGTLGNVPSNTITELAGAVNGSVHDGSDSFLVSNLEFNNEYPARGGKGGDTLEEIRENSLKSFAEQKRIVTLEDYNTRSLMMPSEFGSIAKVYATKEDISKDILKNNQSAISLYTLSYNTSKNLMNTPSIVKDNLRTYLSNYMMLTDAIEFKDPNIINIGIEYDIVIRPGYDSNITLRECNNAIAEYFKTDNRKINEAVDLIEIQNTINNIQGVQTLKSFKIVNKVGILDGYTKYAYDVEGATRNGILYPSYDMSIFEVRYPDKDIRGRVTTL